MAILRKKDRLQRMAEWLPLLASASPEELKCIGEAMVNWYSSGGVVGNDELDFLQFREGQVFGQQTIEDMFPKEPNGRINPNYHRKMKGWASADPAAAKAWLDALEDGSVKQSLVASWFEGAVMADPAGLETRYASLSSAEKSGALGSMMDALHRRAGMEGLTRWFEQQSAAGGDWPRQEAFEKLMWRAGQTATNGFEPVKAMILNPANADCLTSNAIVSATRDIAARNAGPVLDLAGELAAAGRLPDAELRNVIRQSVGQSSRTTINTTGEWLNANPGHPLHDLTARYFVESALRDDPFSAEAWVAKISDPAIQAEALKAIGK